MLKAMADHSFLIIAKIFNNSRLSEFNYNIKEQKLKIYFSLYRYR